MLAVQPATIVVLVSGGVVSSPSAVLGARGVLYAFYGGQLGGAAIVDVLTGAYNPR